MGTEAELKMQFVLVLVLHRGTRHKATFGHPS